MTQERFFIGAPVRATLPLYDGVAAGSRSVVEQVGNDGIDVMCNFEGRGSRWYGGPAIVLDVERLTFPIRADKDPWLESEPRELRGPLCGDTHHNELSVRMATTWMCNRVRFHGGHHVARVGVTSDVYARWPREAQRSHSVSNINVTVGISAPDLMSVEAPIRKDVDRDRLLTKQATKRTLEIESEVEAAIRKVAIALFELDMDEHACRVGDEKRGGIGKAAVLERMGWRLSEEMREVYMWRAAIVLRRAGEMP